MDIKRGQTWKTKDGDIVHVKYTDQVGAFAHVRLQLESTVGTKYTVCMNTGKYAGTNPGLDLVERMPRIYIAGPMTGLPELNFPAFNAAAAELRKRGAWVENPAEINAAGDITWEDAMRADIPRLMTCDSLYLLPGWQQSRGAAIEHDLAVALKMTITYPISE